MNINIKTTTISLTPAISDYVEKRLRPMESFLLGDSTAQCDIELAKTTNHHRQGDIFKAEIHIVGQGMNIYSTAEKEDLYVAIDVVKDEIMRKLISTKDKKQSLIRKGGTKVKNIIKGFWPDRK